MYNLEKYLLVEEQRRIEKMAAAERYRHIKSTQHAHIPTLQIVMTFVGAVLVDWGCRLQSQYVPLDLSSFDEYITPHEATPCSS